jgi:hypothetical protein
LHSSGIVRAIRSRGEEWAGRAVFMGEMRNVNKVLAKDLKGRRVQLEDPDGEV